MDEELKKKYILQQIEMEKETLRRYIKVIAKFNILQAGISGIHFEEHFHISLKQALDVVDKSPVDNKIKNELQFSWFMLGMRDPEHLEKTKEESDLEYYKRLNKHAESVIKDFKQEIKEEIVMDYLENFELWNKQWDCNSKLYERLSEEECIKEQLDAEELVNNGN